MKEYKLPRDRLFSKSVPGHFLLAYLHRTECGTDRTGVAGIRAGDHFEKTSGSGKLKFLKDFFPIDNVYMKIIFIDKNYKCKKALKELMASVY